MVEFGIRIEFRDPTRPDLPHDGYIGAMTREGFRLPQLPSPGDAMMGLGPMVRPVPTVPVRHLEHYPAPHWTKDGMEDGDGASVDVIVSAHWPSAGFSVDEIAEFERRGWVWHPGHQWRSAIRDAIAER